MKPRFLTGDLVTGAWNTFELMGMNFKGMVVSVQQANSVPDARERGLYGLQPWSYWVLTADTCKVLGPYRQEDLMPLPT